MNITRAFAPASVANVFLGFDTLGFALPILGDVVSVSIAEETSITCSNPSIPLKPTRNTAGEAVLRLLHDNDIDHGIAIHIDKGIPLSSGLGGSAASAVAAVVASNKHLSLNLNEDELLRYAILGEKVASGSLHGDNVAASLYGGLTHYTKIHEQRVIELPVPEVTCFIIHPHLKINTSDARKVLKADVSLDNLIHHQMKLTSFIHALHTDDLKLIEEVLSDDIIEPQRKQLIPHFDMMKEAVSEWAMGFTISGAGPTCFAWCKTDEQAEQSRQAIVDLGNRITFKYDTWISNIDPNGARILETTS